MDQTALAVVLTPILGVHTTQVISWLVLAAFVAAQLMPFLPVAAPSSPRWYRLAFGLTARLGGSWRNAAPMPAAGNPPAGGIVPTPPALKP